MGPHEQAQEELVHEVWTDEMLKLQGCKAVRGANSELLFSGVRVKMGVYEGVPTKLMPHTTTGRADYFGPLVNRSSILRFVYSKLFSFKSVTGLLLGTASFLCQLPDQLIH